jgi:hypothetical protein
MWKYTANKHYIVIEYKVHGVEINFNTATEDAKISSLVSIGFSLGFLISITYYYKFVCWENNAYFYWILNCSDVF